MITLLSTLAFAVPTPDLASIPVQLELAPAAAPSINWSDTSDVRKGPDGLLYLTNQDNIHTFDPTTGVVSLFATGQFPGPFPGLGQIAWSADGTLYVAEKDGAVSAVAPTGAPLGYTLTPLPTRGVTVTADDRVFASCDQTIHEIGPAASSSQVDFVVPFTPTTAGAACVMLHSMDTDPSGAAQGSDRGCEDRVIRRYDDADLRPTSDRWEMTYEPGSLMSGGPRSMTILPDGTSFYSASSNIYRVTPDGTTTHFANVTSTGDGAGLYFDADTEKLYTFGRDGLWSFDLGAAPTTPTITWSGICTRRMTLSATGLTPNSTVYVVSSSATGSAAVPSGPCAGTVSGVSATGLGLRRTLTSNAWGAASWSTPTTPAACGASVQVLDLASCAFSNVDPI